MNILLLTLLFLVCVVDDRRSPEQAPMWSRGFHGWTAEFSRVLDQNELWLIRHHRAAAERAGVRRDWDGFAAHLRVRALLGIREALTELPPDIAALRPPAPIFRLTPDAAAAAFPPTLEPLFAAVPLVRETARSSPALRATLVSLMRPPPRRRALRISQQPPRGEGVADQRVVAGEEIVIRYAAFLSAPGAPECQACETVVFELCNTRSTSAFRELHRAAVRREITAGQVVRGIVWLERIAIYETWAVLAEVTGAEGRPPCGTVSSWWVEEDRITLLDGYPWNYYGLDHEAVWVQAWALDPASTPPWPVWVALHRLPNYRLYREDRDGSWELTKEWVAYIKSQAVRFPLYAALDALPPAWTGRFYATPGVEWLDAPHLWWRAVAGD